MKFALHMFVLLFSLQAVFAEQLHFHSLDSESASVSIQESHSESDHKSGKEHPCRDCVVHCSHKEACLGMSMSGPSPEIVAGSSIAFVPSTLDFSLVQRHFRPPCA